MLKPRPTQTQKRRSKKPNSTKKNKKQNSPVLTKKVLLISLASIVVIAGVMAAWLLVTHAQGAASTRQLTNGLGSMQFTGATALTKTANIDPSRDNTISVSDKQGNVWTLTIPAGALTTAMSVSVTPFASVTGPADTQITTGVQFAPDGLMFNKPAMLSVTAPTGSAPLAQIYTAKDDGTQLAYATTVKDGQQAELFHFSTAGASPQKPDPEKVKKQLADTLTALNTYLGLNPSDLPVPPDYNLHCIDNVTPTPNATEAVRKYASEATEPERSIALRLMAIQGLAEKDKVSTSSQEEQTTDDIGKLYDRIDAKLVTAMKAYQSDQNKYEAIWSATLAASAVLQASGREDTKSLGALSSYTLGLINDSLKTLREQHAYSNIQEVTYMRAGLMMLGADTSNINDAIDKAYHFKLRITEDYTATAVGAHFSATGDVPLTPHGINIYSLGLTGQGALKNTYSYGSVAGYFFQNAPSFDVKADVNLLNMCKSPKAFMSQDKYGASTDTSYNFLGQTGTEDALQQLFTDYISVSHSGDQEFRVAAHDKSATAATLDWTNTYSQAGFGSATLSLKYELIHDPR